jgi:dTDP-4-dehydrorhamnose reductase
MLGAMVADVFARNTQLDVVATTRTENLAGHARLPVRWERLDAWSATVDEFRAVLKGATWAVNCIGITKPLIADDDPFKVERAIRVNAQFPHTLAAAAKTEGTRIVQIATDCVFSGARGDYSEDSPHDALDVYGKTKSLGEVSSPNFHHLRASIIGPEPKEYKFLIEWFLRQPKGATINGFVNHDWNGVTTLAFARVALGIVTHGGDALPKLQHLVPSDWITKAAMLAAFAAAYSRQDITIKDVEAPTVIDRTLTTNNDAQNKALWANAGYDKSPSIVNMIGELALFKPRFEQSIAA